MQSGNAEPADGPIITFPPAAAEPVDPAGGPFGWSAGVATGIGGRATNEDRHLIGDHWCAIADGMGGHADGDVAADTVIATIAAEPAPRTVADLERLVDRADRTVRNLVAAPGPRSPGSTLLAATRLGDKIAVVHVGDSRCYQLVGGELRAVTVDHTLTNELIRSRRLDAADAASHRGRHILSRAIGFDGAAEADIVVLANQRCRLLLCTDGVPAELSAAEIGRTLAGVDRPTDAAERLVALAANGPDNATALVIDVGRDVPGAR